MKHTTQEQFQRKNLVICPFCRRRIARDAVKKHERDCVDRTDSNRQLVMILKPR
jgi:hypothetical protein